MSDDIPPIDAGSGSGGDGGSIEALEARTLNAETKLRDLLQREVGQRYWLRWIAVGTGLLVLIGMASFLTCMVNKVFFGPFSFGATAFKVALVAAPILSITTITVTLFVGAFRKFEDKDMDAIQKGIATGKDLWPGGK